MSYSKNRNVAYRPVLMVRINWTWKGVTHYVNIGNAGKNARLFPGDRH